MIRGRVERNYDGGLEPRIVISVRDTNGEFRLHEVILDTGFTGELMLPEKVVRELGLPSAGSRQGIVASSEAQDFEYFSAWMMWRGRLYEVGVLQSIDQSLLGMELLEGGYITVDARDDGEVSVTFS